jgi:Protein of unknown function (DUF2808)
LNPLVHLEIFVSLLEKTKMFNKLAQLISRSLILSTSVLIPVAANAGQFQGQGYFDHAPRLVRSSVSMSSARTPATYQFTISVPQNAGSPLQAVKVLQEKNVDTLSFNPDRSRAFLGDSFAGGTPVALSAIGGQRPTDANELTVEFNPPIAPGQTVTVSLDVSQNPQLGGIYQFEVTAYPIGNNSPGLPLGVGRFNIYDY